MATRGDISFLEAMKSLLVFDGAMGSLLYERGVFVTQNFEQLNVTRPDVVKKIHGDYGDAGAQVLETNTFGANRFRLDRHGLADRFAPTTWPAPGWRARRPVRRCGWRVDGALGPRPRVGVGCSV
jgi:homocysteine S-methyltransferase